MEAAEFYRLDDKEDTIINLNSVHYFQHHKGSDSRCDVNGDSYMIIVMGGVSHRFDYYSRASLHEDYKRLLEFTLNFKN